jgi:HSP20 family protein
MDTPWIPAIELQETDTELWLKVQLPGIEPDQLEIQVSENAVFLSGEYRECHQHDKQGILRSEFHYGQFKRVVPLPIPIQQERVTAAMAGGLLTLIMPKATPAVPNLVKVPLTAPHRKTLLSETHAEERLAPVGFPDHGSETRQTSA